MTAVPRATPRAKGSPRPSRVGLAGALVSLVALAAVIWWAVRQPAPELPSSAGALLALAGAVGLYGVATALRAERWQWLLVRRRARPARADTYGLTTVGYMANNVLPARAGDVLRVVLLAPRAGTSRRTVIGTLVAERVLDVVVLLLLFVVLAYGVLRGIDAPDERPLLVVFAAAVVLAAVCAAVWAFARGSSRYRRAVDFLRPLAAATLDVRGRYGAALVALTLAIWLFEATTYLAVGEAVGLGLDPLEALYLVAVASVFVLIPSGPGYAGTLDAAVVFGVRAVGGSGQEAVSYLILLRVVLLIPITVVGLVVLIARYGGWSRLRAARAERLEPEPEQTPTAREPAAGAVGR
jgi:glycosyltransferase 2 family protein